MKTALAVLASLLLAGAALAQSNSYGDPNFNRQSDWRSGMPNVLKVVAGNVNYQFDGTAAEIPFTLDGGPAEVYLAVYSKDANPQYGGAAIGRGGLGGSMLRAAGLDTFVKEPPDPESPLLRLPQVVATPHLGAMTDGATSNMGWLAMQDCLAVLRGEEPKFRIV